jgi:excisionase family DNA binding protein
MSHGSGTLGDMHTSTEPLMSIKELAAWLRVSRSQVYRLLDDGLPYYRLGDRRFDRDAVLRWLESRKVGA